MPRTKELAASASEASMAKTTAKRRERGFLSGEARLESMDLIADTRTRSSGRTNLSPRSRPSRARSDSRLDHRHLSELRLLACHLFGLEHRDGCQPACSSW